MNRLPTANCKLQTPNHKGGALSRRDFLKSGLAGAAMSLSGWRAWAADEGLPAYYGDYLAGIAARLDALSKTCDDSFFFITDLHVPSNRCMSGRILAKLVSETSVKKVLCGGDLPEAFGGKASVERAIASYRREWVEAVERAGGEFYPAKGNHDFTIRDKAGSPDGWTLSGREARDILMDTAAVKGNTVTNPDDPESCYYYFDPPGKGIRYIVADTTDSIRTDRTYWAVKYGMGEKQLKWLAKNALGTLPAGWLAVVMHHIPIVEIASGENGVPETFAPWRRILEAYQSRGKVEISGETIGFSAARGRVVCSLTGHEHAERQTFKNGIWHITEPCDAAYSDYIAGSAPWCAGLPKKDKGTVFEQTFDAVHIDRRNNVLRFTRIGGGADRIVHLASFHVEAGGTLALVHAAETGANVSWGCYDAGRMGKKPNPANKYQHFCTYFNDIAEISPAGTLTGKKGGVSIALAAAPDGRKTIIPVEVRTSGALRLRVGTYNIRLANGDNGTENAWEKRRDDMVALIRRLDMDVFGAQEVRPEQAAYLREKLPEFEFVGEHRAADRVSDEASPVFYRKSRFEAEKHGTFWLSETPDVPGVVGWGAACPRVCSYLVLRDKESGKRFCFANTHTDHMSAKAREKGMLLVIERMKKFGDGAPVIFVGDHNCRETEAPSIAVSNILANALYESETPPQGPWRTFNCWKWRDGELSTLDALKETPEKRNDRSREGRIDYIYVTRGMRVLDFATVADPRPGEKLYPSDHYPVVATVEL